MSPRIQIRMGGYGPPETGFSRALKRIGDRLEADFADQVEVKYVWNVMDLGYRAEDILWLVEHGVLCPAPCTRAPSSCSGRFRCAWT